MARAGLGSAEDPAYPYHASCDVKTARLSAQPIAGNLSLIFTAFFGVKSRHIDALLQADCGARHSDNNSKRSKNWTVFVEACKHRSCCRCRCFPRSATATA
jgi:hypothetical protein